MNLGRHLEHFSLRWNDFNDNMKSGFHDLLRTEDFVDVTIAAEGKLVQAHKMVLSVCSPYFKNIFKTNPCQHPIVFLKDVTHKELSGILQFMYLGEVSIQQEELGRFLKTAEALQIKGLTGDDSEECGETQKQTNRNKKLPNSDGSNKETVKKMKLNNDSQASPVQNQSESVVNSQDDNISKTEIFDLEFSVEESERLLSKEDSNCESESNLQLAYFTNDRDDGNSSPNSSGPPQDPLSGTQGYSTEPFIMADGHQGMDLDYWKMTLCPHTGKETTNWDSKNEFQGFGVGYLSLVNFGACKWINWFSHFGFIWCQWKLFTFFVSMILNIKPFPLLTNNQGLCPICGRILRHKRNLQTHIYDQHSGMFRSWPCLICNKVCKTWSALRVHTNRHHIKPGCLPPIDVRHMLN